MSFRRPAAVLAATVVALAAMTTVAMAAGQTTVTAPDAPQSPTVTATSIAAGRTPRATVATVVPSTSAPHSTAWPSTSLATTPTTAEPVPVGLTMARDSVPAAGWFHVTGVVAPKGTAIIRYRNVNRAIQVGLADHAAGAVSFWFRAPGAPGSKITIRLEALDGYARPLATLGTITLTTGNAMLPLPRNSGSGRRMVVHSDQQQVWLVEADGRVSGTFLMSGRRLRTASGYDQPGVFRVYSKSRTMRYCDGTCGYAHDMVRYQRTRSSVGTHSLPIEHGAVVQGTQDLGWPLSHGCSRLSDATAHALYAWAPIGTVVVVL